MIEIGYHLSSEECDPGQLVQYARMAEDSGFTYATISDHFHPWTRRQGQSPFVWAVIGAISQTTRRLRLGTAVTCPLQRIHPSIIAQAAATAAVLMEGRFFLGLGTGEKLNEHVTGEGWPEPETRWEMLEEAVKLIRKLWQGGLQTCHGRFYHMHDAQLFTLPRKAPDIYIAANVEASARLAGRVGDGLIAVAAKKDLVAAFDTAGGQGKPRIGNVTVCYAPSDKEARRIAFETWPTTGLSSELHWNLATPQAFEAAVEAQGVTEDQVAAKIICGPRVEDHVHAIEKYIDTGFTHVGVKQCGPDQRAFFEFYRDQVLPRLAGKKLVEVAH